MEITQFTYFQQAGSLELDPVSAEITYGLLRICMYLQKKDSVMDLEWGGGITWGEINRQAEEEFSSFHFEAANTDLYFDLFQRYEKEAAAMLEASLVLPAYDYVIKLSHIFNILDARGVVSVTERTGYLARIRTLARRVALLHMEKREALGFPLLKGGRTS
jgi:glycyl-tRNA synthetase alpha chain